MKYLYSFFALFAFYGIAFAQGQSQLLTENFNGTTIPSGWTQNTMATDGGWNAGSAAALSSSYFTIPTTGSNIVATNDDDCNCNKSEDWLISSPINTTGVSAIHVSFKMFYFHAAYQGAQESAEFLYSTDNGTTWTTVQNITNGASVWQDMYFDISNAAGNASVLLAFKYGDGGGWNYGMAIEDLSVYVPYAYDLTATNIDLYPVQGLNNAPFTVSGSIQNVGNQTINNIDLNYQINGTGTVYTIPLTNLGLAPFATYAFTHTTTWNPSAAGNYTLDAWASNPDGNTDQDPTNDKFSKQIEVVPVTVQRQVLVEEFTSSTCAPCASFNAQFTPIVNANSPNTANGKINVVKYQMNWPSPGTDPNYNQHGVTRKNYYGVNGVPNPFMDANDGFSSQEAIDALYQVPSLVEISGAWSYQGTDAQVTVNIDPKANINGNLKLRIAVLDKEIKVSDFPGYAVTNGETEFNFVMRAMLPDGNGKTLGNLTANQTTSHYHSHLFTIGGVAQNNTNIWYGMDDLQVVAWIQDDSDKSILQSATLTAMGIGIKEFEDVANSVNVFPNPANHFVNVELDLIDDAEVNVEILNTLGQVVAENSNSMVAGYNKSTFDVSSLPTGVYVLQLTIDGVSVAKRISITR